jgi:hypothetical protein
MISRGARPPQRFDKIGDAALTSARAELGDAMRRRRRLSACAALLGLSLTACASSEVRVDTLQMVDSVSRIRDVQVLRNVAAAIDDHDMVPTQILLSTGQASVTTEATPSVSAPFLKFLGPTASLQASATDSWTAQWQISPVTNADDLRRLRNLYVLIVSTDEQYDTLEAYFARNPEMRATSACYGLQTAGKGADQGAANGCPPGYGAGQIPKWREALVVIEDGDSIGCKLYQEGWAGRRANEPSPKGVPFRRWLYWRRPGGPWLPAAPDAPPQTLGRYGGWELATTSRACFDDFVILVQSATPEAAGAGAQGARVMLSTH